MKNIIKSVVIGFVAVLTFSAGIYSASALYLSSFDKIQVEKTVNNVLNDKGYSFCSTSAYTKYISELNNYANYFDRNSRDYNFSKSIATKLQEKCNSYRNRNTNRYQNNCYGSRCNNSISITASRCGTNGCINRNTTMYSNINRYHNNCGYNGCERRTYKKGTFVYSKNGIEIRKTGRNVYLYDGSKLVLTYVLSTYERNNFSVYKIGGENGFFIISKKNRYGVITKWFYNCFTNTIAKLNVDYIKNIKKDRFGNYYFLATKNGCTTLYKYNGRTIIKKSNGYNNIINYSILSNGEVRIHFYDYRRIYISQIIR